MLTDSFIEEQVHRRIEKLMGNRFEITVVSPDAQFAQTCIQEAIEEIKRIESLLTTYRPDSTTARINDHAGIAPVQVEKEVFDLIERSIRISKLTQGAFDITYGSIDKSLWNFDKTMTSLPDAATCKKMVRLINYNNIILDRKNLTVMLKEKGMRIGFGGIGKGYAADKAKALLAGKGIESGIVNAAGDLACWGFQPDGKPWTVGIADPDRKEVPFSYMNISNLAIATSGNYEKFVTINGKKYSHTIDPATGLPVTGIKSVSVISPIAELSDALATPLSIMGIRAGLDMINQMNGIACIIIDDNNTVYTSENISII